MCRSDSDSPFDLFYKSLLSGVFPDDWKCARVTLLFKQGEIASRIGAIKRTKYFVPTPTLHCIYNTLIQSQFNYCNILWGNCGKTLFDRLQKLQNCAARVLTFLDMMPMPTVYLDNLIGKT